VAPHLRWFCQLSRRVFDDGASGNFSGRLHNVEHDRRVFDEARAAEGGRNDLVVTAARTEEIAEFTMFTTEAVGRGVALKSAHTSDSPFDAPKVLFKAVI
jgi:hypothetical protein